MSRPINAEKKCVQKCNLIAREYIALDTDGNNDICIWESTVQSGKFGMSVVSYENVRDGLAMTVSFEDINERLLTFREVVSTFYARMSENVEKNISVIKRRMYA